MPVEKRRFEKWASLIRDLYTTDWRLTILPESYDEVIALTQRLDFSYQKALECEKSKEGFLNKVLCKTRVKSLGKGFGDLLELLYDLDLVNLAIEDIISPGSITAWHDRRDRSTIRDSKSTTPKVPEGSWDIFVHDPQFVEARVPLVAASNVDVKPNITRVLHLIWQATLDSLVILSIKRPDPHIARSASRLQFWGASLFKMNMPLDKVFESHPENIQGLRRCILKIFVEILVWEGE